MTIRERRYSRYKAADVWATLYEQQEQLDAFVHNGTVTGNCVSLSRPLKAVQEKNGTYTFQSMTEEEKRGFYADPTYSGVTYKAVVLARAADWYKYSLNCQDRWKHGITAIVCGTHDSCVPVPVLALDQLKWHEPLTMRVASIAPLSFDQKSYVNDHFDLFRRGQYGHNMLIGALMCGREDATIRLAHMRESTRLRIEAKLKKLHQRRAGRPLEV
jgi:hypothetical protein